MQILPHKELLPFIKHYIFLDYQSTGLKKLRLFSDGNTGIVFSLQKKLQCIDGQTALLKDLPNALLYGQLTDFKDVVLAGCNTLIIVVFQPAGINNIFAIPASELRNNITCIEDLFGRNGISIYEKLSADQNVQSRVNLLNVFFKSLLVKKQLSTNSFIEPALNYVYKTKGMASVEQLVKFTGYTERHIERQFAEAVGLSPKKFANIVRLHFFIREIKNKTNLSNFTAAAYETGYSDQSHSVKEFKKYTGITPGEYVYKTEKLTSNFIHIS